MELDLEHYNRDVVIKGEHFYTKTTSLNEVFRGKTENLHSDDLVSKFDEEFANVSLSSVTLNVAQIKVSNSKEFSSQSTSSTSRLARGKAVLDPSDGRGFSYFGNARLIEELEVVVKESDDETNQILLVPSLKYTSDDPRMENRERLQFQLILSKQNFEEFYRQAEQNPSNLLLQLEIYLTHDSGIYERWDPTGDWDFNYVLKVLTRQILKVSKIDEETLPTINGQIFDKFKINWIDPSKVELHEPDEIDPFSIEYIQSRGSKHAIEKLVNKNKPSWIKRNWVWFALAFAALIGFLR